MTPSRPGHLFELRTAKDLFNKLKRNLVRLEQNPVDEDAAFDFFVTAYHILDWLYPGRDNKGQRDTHRDSEPLLQVCDDLCNGAKHFHLDAARHNRVSDTLTEAGAFDAGGFQQDAFDVGKLVVELSGTAAQSLGAKREVLQLARDVVNYWESQV
jgi:hypothetical protein